MPARGSLQKPTPKGATLVSLLPLTSSTRSQIMSPVLLIAGVVHFATNELDALKSKYDILVRAPSTSLQLSFPPPPPTLTFRRPQDLTSANRQTFFEACKEGGEYSKVQAIYHNGLPNGIGPFDKELVNALPESVKLVAHHGAGYDVSRLTGPYLVHD